MSIPRKELPIRPELTMFGHLHAEAEPWLASCYVPPAEFSLLVEGQSTLVFGESGSGKTSLRMALSRAWEKRTDHPDILVVEWPVHAFSYEQSMTQGSPLAAVQQLQVYSAIGRSVLHLCVEYPVLWAEAPDWVRLTLGWFVHRFLQSDPLAEMGYLAENMPKIATELLAKVTDTDNYSLLSQNAPPVLVMAKISEALQRIGIAQVRVTVDNVEPWWEAEPDRLANCLSSFLSTLALFEHPGFAYIMFLPMELLPLLSRSSAVVRRRVQAVRIQMRDTELVAIVQRRLSLALDRADFELRDLGPVDKLCTWLAGCGGSSPRGWLEAARPFLVAYLEKASSANQPGPLTLEEFRQVQRLHPPSMWLDLDTHVVTVGWRRIEGLSPGQFAILRYLVNHPAQLCTRRQLFTTYVTAYPDSWAEPDAKPAEYAGTLDSALWRLRSLIEPDPDHPVLLETKKGQGVICRFM